MLDYCLAITFFYHNFVRIHETLRSTPAMKAGVMPFNEPFDIIFLRNVMLYFSTDTRRTLLQGIHKLLAKDGVLFLGSSEQPADPSIWKAMLLGGTCHFLPK